LIGRRQQRYIGAEISWSRTYDPSARTRPVRQEFLQRFEREIDPDGVLPPDERRRRAEHTKHAFVLRLAQAGRERPQGEFKPAGQLADPSWRKPGFTALFGIMQLYW
jgi:hypothetical protein